MAEGAAAIELFRQRKAQRAPLRAVQASPGKRVEPLNVERLLKEYETGETERRQFEGAWRDAFRIFMPQRNVLDHYQPGADKQREIYNSMPAYLYRRGAGNLIGALMPPERKWIKFEAGGDVPENQRDRVNDQLEEWRDVLFDYLGRSSFATEAHSMALDLMLGTGAMTIDPGDEETPLKVRSWSSCLMVFVEGPDGQIRKRFRKYGISLEHLVEMWPYADLPSSWARDLTQEPTRKVQVLECSWTIPGQGERFAVIDSDEKHIVVDVGPFDPFEPPRWITPRMYSAPDETYGRGPGLEALPDARTLNKVDELELKGMLRYWQPPLAVDSNSGLNPHTIRMSPNAVHVVNAPNGRPGDAIQPLNLGGGAPQFGQVEAQKRIASLEKILFAQEIVPPADLLPNVTATAVALRRQAILAEQGVDFGRLNRDFLFAAVSRASWCLAQLGKFPPIRVDGKQVKVRYVGPMAQAQDIEEAQSMLDTVAAIAQTVGPEATMVGLKMEEVPGEAAKLRGLPGRLIRDEAEREQIQQMMAQAAQQAATQA